MSDDTSLLTVTSVDAAPITPTIDGLLGFYDASVVGRAYEQLAWTPDDETRVLIEIARSYADDPNAAIKALEVLSKRRLDSLRFSGHLARITASQHTDDAGRTTREIAVSATRIAQDSLAKTLAFLDAGRKSRAVITAESPTNGRQQPDSNDRDACGRDRQPVTEEESGTADACETNRSPGTEGTTVGFVGDGKIVECPGFHRKSGAPDG